MKTNSRMILFFMTMVSTSYVQGQTNLLPNGDFSDAQGISGWTAQGPGTMIFRSSVDADDSSTSGSMVLTYSDPETATSSCFPVQSNAYYSFGGKYAGSMLFDTFSVGEMSCKSYTDSFCTSGEVDLGLASSVDGDASNKNTNFATLVPVIGTLSRNAIRAKCAATAYASSVFTVFSPQPVSFDDLFFDSQNPASTSITLGGYLSGSWYNPVSSGQGFELEFTAQSNEVIATWFTFKPDGSGDEIWIYAEGKYDPSQNTVTIPAVISAGTNFLPAFNSSDIKKVPWGTLTFSFITCNQATVSWNSTVAGYGSGTQQLTRLTSIAGLSCAADSNFF